MKRHIVVGLVPLPAPGGVYGAYDAARVADPTAGQAWVLRSGAMQAIPMHSVRPSGNVWRRSCAIPAR